MVKAAQRAAWIALLLVVVIAPGCAQPLVEVPLELPIIEPEPQVKQEPTLLERFQEVSQMHESEKNRAASLEAQLGEQTEARKRAEAELQELRQQIETLEQKAQELANLKIKYDEAQTTLLGLEADIRDMRGELLEERLTRVKCEQTIAALKIEKAKERRKHLISEAQFPQETSSPEGTSVKEKTDANH